MSKEDVVDRATDKAVSRRLPTAAARVLSQVTSCGICCGQNGTGAGFLWVFLFPLPLLIPLNAPYSSIIQGGYNRPIKGRRSKETQSHPTPPHEIKKKLKKKEDFEPNKMYQYGILLSD
jgi:hypothetical protein